MTVRNKIIEVPLSIEAINKASAREKSIWHSHASTHHLWSAQRCLWSAEACI